MLSYQYDESGDWLAATLAGRLVVVRSDGSANEADRLWASLDGGVQGMLAGLTAQGLFSAPSFVMVTWQGTLADGVTVNAIVRGDVSLRLTTTTGADELSGAGVATWREQSFAAVTGFLVECGPSGHERSSSAPLPLAAGMVRARRVALATRMPMAAAAVRVEPAVVGPVPVLPVLVLPVPVEPVAFVPVPVAPTAVVPVPVPVPVRVEPVAVEPARPAAVRIGPVPVAPAPVALPDTVTDETLSDEAFTDDTVNDETVVSVGRTPVRAAAPEPDTDHHDGQTVLSGDIRKLRGAARASVPLPAGAAPAGPVLFLLLPGGVREPLGSQPVLVGRAPSVSQVPGGRLPRLVSLGGGDQDISRNHVRFTVEGDTVVVTDLQSRNGTVIVLPGRPPQKLRKGEAASVLVGTVIDLGGGVTLSVGEE